MKRKTKLSNTQQTESLFEPNGKTDREKEQCMHEMNTCSKHYKNNNQLSQDILILYHERVMCIND